MEQPLHPLLVAQLQGLDLDPSQVPSPEQWRALLTEVSTAYQTRHEGALILDRSFDKMIRHAVDAFLIHDTHGRILEVNEATSTMLGYSRDELLNMEIRDFEMELSPGAIWDDMTVDQVFTVEGRHRKKDGSTYPVETRLGAFNINGQKVILALCRDITERKQTEERLQEVNKELRQARNKAVQASETKSQYLANMSHELRTPLNAIIGYSELLIDEMTDAGQTEFLDIQTKIVTAGQHLYSLINDVLDLAKIESGKVELHCSTFTVSSLVDDIQATITPLAEQKHNEFRVTTPAIDPQMHSDPTKLRQILINLLGNASKFTEHGVISLHVRRKGDTHLLFEVADTGLGMTPEELSVVFDAFQQARHDTARNFGGTGLGLAITQKYAHLLGGSIDVFSSPGEGTIFRFTAPLHVTESPDNPVDA